VLEHSSEDISEDAADLEEAREAKILRQTSHAMLGQLYTDQSTTEVQVTKFKELSEKAYRHLRQAVKLKRDDVEALYGCGLVQVNLRQWLLAVEHFTAALDVDPKYAPAFHQRGLALMMMGRLEEAAKSLDDYLTVQEAFFKQHLPHLAELQKNFVTGDVFLRLSACHYELDNQDLAELYADSSIACQEGPHKSLAQHLLAKVECTKPESDIDFEKVVALNSEALSVNGTLLNAYRDRAVALQRLGRTDEAEADLKVYERLAKLSGPGLDAEFQRQTDEKTADARRQMRGQPSEGTK
jgi:Flp pilus assembly protein TadD